MALTITRGYTLTDGVVNNYNATTLAALVASATVTSIPMSAFATTAHVIQVAASIPGGDQGDGSLWFDSTLGVLREKNGNVRWDCPYVGPGMLNNSGVTIPKGAVVVASSAGEVSMCATAFWSDTLGSLAATVVNGVRGLVRSKGYGQGLVFGPVTMGDFMFARPTGYLYSFHATGITTATLGVAIAKSLSSCASGATMLANLVFMR